MQRTRPITQYLSRLIWLSVLPPVLVAAWMAIDNVLSLQDETRQQAAQTAQNFATVIDQFLDARIRALNILAVSPLADTPQRWAELYAEAQGFRESFGSHVIFASTDEPMRMLFNTRSPFGASLPPLPRPEGHAAAPAAVATGKPAAGDTFMGPIAKEPLIAVAVPGIRDGKIAHLLLSILETRQLQHLLNQLTLPASWSLTLQDSKGDVIAQRATVGIDAIHDVDDEHRFIIASTHSPWKVVLEIPRNAFHGPLLTAGLTLTFAVVSAALAGILGGILGGRRLSRQVSSLISPEAPDAPPLNITEIAAARHLLDAAVTSQRLNESRYQAIFEHASIGIAQVTLEGVFLQVNRAVCVMFDYPPEELRTMTWKQLTPPDELPTDLEYVRKLLAGDIASYTREKQFIARNNRLLWANLGVSMIRQPDGAPDYFIAIVENIQARKEAQTSLLEKDALLTDMGALTHAGGWAFDVLTGKVQWTPEAARIHGLPIDAPIDVATGLNCYTVEYRPILEAAIHASIHDAKPYDLELEILTAAGQRKWVRTIGHPVIADGQVVRVRGAIQDITARKLATLALAESEQRYRHLVENANSAILQWAPDGTILFCNDHALEILGWAREELLGKHISVVLPERESTGTVLSGLVEAIVAQPERFRHIVNENIRRDGSRLWMSWTNTVLHGNQGQITGILAIGSDITAHQQLLEELKQRNEELERFNQASIGRELQMVELKRRINKLCRQLGQEPPYDLSFVEGAS
jgi:PAS domain S-box-containing protein